MSETKSEPILCHDCGHEAFKHYRWFCGDEGACKTDGCKCKNTAQQVIEKWLINDRANVRRAALLEAAKAVCEWCGDERIGYKNLMWVPGECKYCHGWSGPLCRASAIHALLAQEQTESEI